MKQWWRRAAAAAKDKQTICLTRVSSRRSGHPDMEAAVIHATSHDELSLDHKNARRVFAWARTSPSSYLHPLMYSLARRATRTRCWAVALKSLLLAHGLLRLFSSSDVTRLPFDLSDFRDRSPRYRGFSAFVRAYFNFLDHRSLFLSDNADKLERLEKLQVLLDLLLQVRPYADGMQVGLIIEALDCILVEIFEVYCGICNRVAAFLVGYMDVGVALSEERRRRGLLGIRILRRATEQNDQLESYFEMCRRLGVPNAAGLPPVERVPEEDIRELEKLLMGGGGERSGEEAAASTATENWVLFDCDGGDKGKKPSEGSSPQTWASIIVQEEDVGNLIEL